MKLKSLIELCDHKTIRQMTEEESRALISLILNETNKGPLFELPSDILSEETGSRQMRIMEGRLKWVGLETMVSNNLKMFVGFLCKSPGEVVMWCYTFAHMIHRNNNEKIDISTFVNNFPFGIPTDVVYKECWERQKGINNGINDKDNLMDVIEWWGIS